MSGCVATIKVRGAFLVEDSTGHDITPSSRRAKALIGMVALAPSKARARKWLQDKLWSTRAPEQGSASMRSELSALRKHFQKTGIDLLEIQRDSIKIPQNVQVENVEYKYSDPGHVQLLEGLDIDDPEFEDWLREERLNDHSTRNALETDLSRGFAQGTSVSTQRPHIVFEKLEVLCGSERGSLFAEGLMSELATVFGALSGAISTRSKSALEKDHEYYVLKGSIQIQNQIRILVQLYHHPSDNCIWSGRFSYSENASFDAQQEIARKIAEETQIKLRDGEWARNWADVATSIEAWEHYQRGRVLEAQVRKESLREARRHYRNALLVDENFTPAMVALAFCLLDEVRLGWAANPSSCINEATRLYSFAIELRPQDLYARSLEAFIEAANGRLEEACEIMKSVFSDASDSPELVAYYAVLKRTNGDLDGAIELYQYALNLTPHPPTWIHTNIALAYILRDDHRADHHTEIALAQEPNSVRGHLCKILIALRDNRQREAEIWAARLKSLQPDFRAENWRAKDCFSDEGDHGTIARKLQQVAL